ncbi:MAG: mercury methylation corrinoid protein HgcA [Desulfuromonadia bacterium]
MSYAVPAGLYGVGDPGPDSPVIVTCNYKMTWDRVRRSLHGRNVWILVLQTFGVNVWCAAGKGTFGTAELVKRIQFTGLASVVSHRRLVLPILGAVGVSAHRVTKQSGFSVDYATIRADDIPQWLDNGMVTTLSMRRLTFSFWERGALVPVELIQGVKQISWAVVPTALTLGNTVSPQAAAVTTAGLVGGMICGTVVGPLLLPWLPFRYFSAKGAFLGGIWTLLLWWLTGRGWRMTEWVGLSSVISAVSGYYLFAFTGCTPFTSRTGVKREMRCAIPLMGVGVGVGVLAMVVEILMGNWG